VSVDEEQNSIPQSQFVRVCPKAAHPDGLIYTPQDELRAYRENAAIMSFSDFNDTSSNALRSSTINIIGIVSNVENSTTCARQK
jgi:hypothetical protein